jgi:S1-C subfamily serine protease
MASSKELLVTVTFLACFKNGNKISTATGFFYSHLERLYLITNRHVVVDESENYFPDEIKMRLHTNRKDIRDNEDVPLSLYDGAHKPSWLEHPTGGQNIDVIALPLSLDMTRFNIKSFCDKNHVPKELDISVGEDVLVIGYPMGFYDSMHNLPIIRNAIIASVYPVPFQGKPLILIDSRLHRGTSGSPVITKTTNTARTQDGKIILGNSSYLVGVHSATFDIIDRDPIIDEPLGLNAVWFAHLIPEIIEQRRVSI